MARKLVVVPLRTIVRLVEIKRALRRALGLFLDMQVKEMRRRLFQRVGMEIGMDQIPGKLGVEQRLRQRHTDAFQQVGLFLIPMHHHGLVMFVKYRLQLGRHVTVNTIGTNRFIMCSDHQRRIGRVPRLAFAFHLQHPRMRHGLRTLLRMINGEAGGSRLRRDFTFVMQMPVRHRQIVSYPCFQCFRRVNRFILRYFQLAGLVLLHGIVGGLPRIECSQHTVFGAYAEFKSGEQLVELVGVHLTESQILDGHAKVKVTHQGIHGTIQFDLIDIGPQRLAFFAADFVGMLDNLVKSAIQVDPFGRESIAHAGNAGDVVGGFATKRGKIRILLRRDVVFLHHRVGSHVLQIFEMMPRIQHGDVVVDELERVTIAG